MIFISLDVFIVILQFSYQEYIILFSFFFLVFCFLWKCESMWLIDSFDISFAGVLNHVRLHTNHVLQIYINVQTNEEKK